MKQEIERASRGESTAALWPVGGDIPEGFAAAFATRAVTAPGLPPLVDFARTGGDKAKEARDRLCEALGLLPGSLSFAKQIHSANVAIAGPGQNEASGFLPEADALISNAEDAALAVFTADCVPILMADPGTGAFAAVHAGWRGMTSGVIENALAAMKREFGTDSEAVSARLGPCVGQCCYEVGGELLERLSDSDRKHLRAGETGGPRLDLDACCRSRLEASGLKTENIFSAGVCTKCRPDLFASYRGRAGGLNISIIFKRPHHGGAQCLK